MSRFPKFRIAALIALGMMCLWGCHQTAAAAGRLSSIAKQEGTWEGHLVELTASDSIPGDTFGAAVAISDETAVIGAPGHAKGAGRAYVFSHTSAGWRQVAELKGSDVVANDNFGSAVAIAGRTIAIGAPNHASEAGRVYVFTKTGTGWRQTAELKGSDTVAGDSFGTAVGIAGTNIVVGSPSHPLNVGRAYVFSKARTGWHEMAELKGSGIVAPDSFGISVAISGTTVVIGSQGPGSGRAFVFTRTGVVWHQVAELKGPGLQANDGFGNAVGSSGSTIIVGAPRHASLAGRAFVFARTKGGWNKGVLLQGSGTLAGDSFGTDVAISAAAILVGALGPGSGHVYVFTKTKSSWHQVTELNGGPDLPVYAEFGKAVAISGNAALIGAPGAASTAGRAFVTRG